MYVNIMYLIYIHILKQHILNFMYAYICLLAPIHDLSSYIYSLCDEYILT